MVTPNDPSGDRDVLLGRCAQGIDDLKELVKTGIVATSERHESLVIRHENLAKRVALLENYKWRVAGFTAALAIVGPILVSLIASHLNIKL